MGAHRSFTSLLLIASSIIASHAAVLPPPIERRSELRLEAVTLESFQDATADQVTESYLTLERSSAKSSRSSQFLHNLQRARNSKRDVPNAPLVGAIGGQEYLVDLTVGTQTFKMIVDTGSSDTWLIESDFKCTDASGNSQSQASCNFGPTYKGNFGANQIPNVNFNVGYGDGETVTGTFGYEDVTIAGITVPHQEVALGNLAYWNGDSISSGLVGLAYPAITSAYVGTDPSQDTSTQRVQYDPLFTTMYKQNLSAPMFSMAIQRGDSGGYIAFGGLPPVTYTGAFAKTPIQVLTGRSSTSDLTFYTITPDALVYTGAAKTQRSQYIVDSGTTLNYMPSAEATRINNLFSPRPNANTGALPCNAKAPSLGVKIGGTTFVINPTDMILKDPSTGQCITGIQDGGTGPYILGDVFMKNVVAVFDVGAAEMRFAAHTTY